LIVDGDAELSSALALLLAEQGLDAETTGGGASAAHALGRQRFDLVIDLNQPLDLSRLRDLLDRG
jgi:DNA-binding response OmpR family regulator